LIVIAGAAVLRAEPSRTGSREHSPLSALAGLRVIDIAAAAGFADVTHFHRVFRQLYGQTPTQLRRATHGSG
jgi:AraC-like DNA-binding protein